MPREITVTVTDRGQVTHRIPLETPEPPMRPHHMSAAERTVREAPRRACDSTDLSVWFPTSDSSPLDRRQIAEAKSICWSCPVLEPCARWALQDMSHGIAGGMTETERRQWRRMRWSS